MSGLRQTLLEKIRIMGNASGCHQLPERSFFYKGKQFPVCARCTGVFVGQVTALVMIIFKAPMSFLGALFAMIPMGVDWTVQFLGIKTSNNWRRFFTGIGGGFAVICCYWCMLKFLLHKINHN